ncbi:MAG: Holliday junction resolvase RuvX [Planctomycetales bacterium]
MAATSEAPPGEIPQRGRLMGLDYGQRRVGLALSNLEQSIATPLATYTRRDDRQDTLYLQRQVQDYSVVALVVGLPVHMSGDEGEQAREARAFGQWAAAATRLPVVFFDERYTTAHANELLRDTPLSPRQRQARRDMLAAQILLQGYLDGTRENAAPAAME